MHKKSGKSRRPTGSGKSIDTPSKGKKGPLSGADQLEGAPKTKGERGVVKVNPDSGYAGNVTGPYSQPVRLK